MDITIIIARLIHVLGGIFWVGAMLFVTAFLGPAVAEAGPEGGKVMGGIMRRGYMRIVPVVAVLTMLSGIWLYWKASAGFDPVYMRSGPGHVFAVGGGISILAYILGITVTRPAMLKSMSLAQSAATADPGEREAILAEAQRLRVRGARTGMVVAWMLIITSVAMAVGRYA